VQTYLSARRSPPFTFHTLTITITRFSFSMDWVDTTHHALEDVVGSDRTVVYPS